MITDAVLIRLFGLWVTTHCINASTPTDVMERFKQWLADTAPPTEAYDDDVLPLLRQAWAEFEEAPPCP